MNKFASFGYRVFTGGVEDYLETGENSLLSNEMDFMANSMRTALKVFTYT